MVQYTYSAIDAKGNKLKGSMNANNLDDLEYKLGEIEIDLLSAKSANQSGFRITLTSNAITTKNLILLCTHFEQLDKAGVPITKAIEDLRDSEDNPKFRDLMQDIYESVKSGKQLSEAMSEHPKVFDEVFVGLIASGEKTGNLHQSFAYLGEHLKWSDEIKRKTKKAIRYPIFLLIVVFGVTAVMMIVVIPKLSDFLLKQKFDLPFYTVALISFSNFFVAKWQLLIIIPVALFITHKIFLLISKPYAYFIDKSMLHLPFIGPTLLKLDIARFTQFFLITFNSGIEVIECFDIVERVVSNLVIKKTIRDLRQDISEGNAMSDALKSSGVFPNLVIRMFEVGEATGNMSDALINIKFFYDKEVNDSVDALVGIIQPALTLVMGGLLLWISISVFGPLYSSFGNIG